MKKLMLILAVAIMAAPALATITFTAHDDGGGLLRIAYTTDGSDEPRGVALEVSLSGDATAENPVVSTDPNYNCYMDHAWDVEKVGGSGPGTYDVGEGQPLANADTQGSLTAPASTFVISMGVLDTDGGQLPGPGSTTNLITLQLSSSGTCDVTIIGDTTRGPESGVVGSVIPSNLYVGETVIPLVLSGMSFPVVTECVKSDAPFYDEWVGAGKNWDKPDCWCYEYNCRGDADGLKIILFRIQNFDLGILADAFNKGDLMQNPTRICADFDHKKVQLFRVQNADLAILAANFNKGDLQVSGCPMDWDGDTDDDYNFWIVP